MHKETQQLSLKKTIVEKNDLKKPPKTKEPYDLTEEKAPYLVCVYVFVGR